MTAAADRRPRSYRLDATWSRHRRLVLAGSPLRIFKLTDAGTDVAARLERGDDVEPSHLVDRLLDAGAIHPTPGAASNRFTLGDVTVVTPQYARSRADVDGRQVCDDGRITVDDGSQPPLPGATMALAVNRGPAAARNAARPLVTTPLVAFLDADVDEPQGRASWVEPLLWHFDDPRVGLVAPRVAGESWSPLDLGDEPARIRAGTRVSYVPGAALLVRTEALDVIGWFDEGLRFGEDVDLVWRLDDAGWWCRYDPSVSVWHRPRRGWAARLRQHAGYGTSVAPLALRHPRALTPIRVNGWTAAAWAGVITGHVITGAALAVGSAARLERRVPELGRGPAFAVAMRGHLAAGWQIAEAVRRTWWPIVAVGALVSRRCRLLGALSLAAGWRTAATDLAYGWGVWKGMRDRRTLAPIVPRLVRWPGSVTKGV